MWFLDHQIDGNTCINGSIFSDVSQSFYPGHVVKKLSFKKLSTVGWRKISNSTFIFQQQFDQGHPCFCLKSIVEIFLSLLKGNLSKRNCREEIFLNS